MQREIKLLERKLSTLFKNRETALKWLFKKNTALGGKKPLECIAEGDIEAVFTLISRVEHGIYS